MKSLERIYFGTWQLGGQFKKLSPACIESLLLFAVNLGIRRFDTAAVYGNGEVEKTLGLYLPKDAVIVTKIPAISKPNLKSPEPIRGFYTRDSIRRSAQESLKRLRRTCVDTLLLHNWTPAWSSDFADVLEYLNELKCEGVTDRVGISLPDDFSTPVDKKVLSYIDVVEAPFNSGQRWLLSQLPYLLERRKEVLLRSLFGRGRLISEQSPAESLLQSALSLGTSVVIGMTTEEQIAQNIAALKGISNEPE